MLLARSRMHAIDLRRELVAQLDADQRVELGPGELRGQAVYRNLIFVPAVVEFILKDETIARRVAREPSFLQYAYDALYYLLGRWERNEAPAISEPDLRRYLEERIKMARPRRRVAGGVALGDQST